MRMAKEVGDFIVSSCLQHRERERRGRALEMELKTVTLHGL